MLNASCLMYLFPCSGSLWGAGFFSCKCTTALQGGCFWFSMQPVEKQCKLELLLTFDE